MKKSGYLFNAALLTATSLLLRAAGMAFRVVVAGRLGAEGMGLHQLIFTVYQLFITVATSGISVAATRLVTEELAAGRPGAVRSALYKTAGLAAGLGAAAGAAQAALAVPMSRWWLGDERAAASLCILAPSLPFMAVAAALRGYFLARRQAGPNAGAQIFEQALRIAVVMLLLDKALARGIGWGCAAVVAGNTISEIASCLVMAAGTGHDLSRAERGAVRRPAERTGARLREILLPIAGGRWLSSALRTAENVMVPACLAAFCASREMALEQYGALKGMAMPVLFFPFSLLGTLATLLTPEITEAHMKGNKRLLQRLCGRVVSITTALAVLMGGLFTLLAYPLGQALYGSREIGFYLRVLGPVAPLMYLEGMVDGVLKGLNEQLATFRYSVWDSALRIGFIAFLVPRFGMAGFLGVMLFSNVLTGVLNFRRLLVMTEMPLRLWQWVAGPVLCAAAGCGAAGRWLWPALGGAPLVWRMILTAAGASAAYALLAAAFGVVKPEKRKTKKAPARPGPYRGAKAV